jgi:alpha-L-fucosidase
MSISTISRRGLLKSALAVAPSLAIGPTLFAAPHHRIARGPFQPTWESLRTYQTPEWFRDAKFGIWNHWTAQCVPEQGDWYARRMYLQGDKDYNHHLKTYGHPSKSGFMELDNLWKAERWQPEQLMDLYVAAGAKYFTALANHHDNFDNFNSRFHHWNSVKVGPKQDIVGIYTKLARARGLRVAVTNHSAHAWHWFQSAYGYDPVGPLQGIRYDAYTLTRADGKGKWWDGLDPQELYSGRNIVMPDGITSIAAADQWHETHDRVWNESIPAVNPRFAENWYQRCQDLLDTYKPDLLYFDDSELPLEQYGLDITAHFYNSSVRDKGRCDVVVTAKSAKPDHLGAFTLDIERGKAKSILEHPWQTDTCIGDWHYDRSIFERHAYKTPRSVIHSLIDIVSKNGNLMLNIPLRGDGTLDEDEHAFLKAIATWIPAHGEAIYGTRPFTIFGEGPPDVTDNQNFNERSQRPYTHEDIRFTTKGDTLYAFALGWPANGTLLIKTLSSNSFHAPKPVKRVELIGAGQLSFTQSESGITLSLPSNPPNEYAYAFVIHS